MQADSGINVNLVINFTLALVAVVFMLFILFIVFNKKLNRQKNNSINKLLIGEQNERSRIARDLHDRMALTIFDIIHTIDDIELTNPAKAILKKEEAKQKLKTTSQTIRDIAHDIMPETLNEFGLVYTIQKLAENPPPGITIHFADNTFDKSFASILQNHLYSIILELIQNTIKHSGGDELTLELFYHSANNELHFSYYDNGNGFDNKQKNGGIGLQNIRTRAAIINALVDIQGDEKFYLFMNIKL